MSVELHFDFHHGIIEKFSDFSPTVEHIFFNVIKYISERFNVEHTENILKHIENILEIYRINDSKPIILLENMFDLI